jgi:hypothetical protein
MPDLKAGNEKKAPNINTTGPIRPISLQNGGVIHGIGEMFTANVFDRTQQVTIPMCGSRGRFGFGLQLIVSAYTLAVIAVGAALGGTLWLGSVIKHTPTVFFCSIVLTSWFGGVFPGIFASLLAAIALDYYFIPPIYALGIGLEEAPDVIAFLTSSFFVSWAIGRLKQLKDPPTGMRDRSDNKVSEPRQVDDQLLVGTSHHRNAEENPTEAKVKAFCLAPTGPSNEHVPQITPERNESTVPAAKLLGCEIPPEKKHAVLIDGTREFLLPSSSVCSHGESMFLKQGDYWTVQYQGQIAHLKSTRGLHCLASLLGSPGREFHVSELAAVVGELSIKVATEVVNIGSQGTTCLRSMRLEDAGPILDLRAKAEYRRRLAELQAELDDAERLNNPERSERIHQEKDCLTEQLAVAVGLGGRARKTSSQAERARSAVTKRIKDSIRKIAKAIPSLGEHLDTSVKTGYFCSYRPHADCSSGWKVEF